MNNCTSIHNGLCRNDQCYCRAGYEGPDCGRRSKCKNDCNLRGLCYKGICLCNKGYAGESCEEEGEFIYSKALNQTLKQNYLDMDSDCPSLCTGHGVCQSGKCLCDLEWEGIDCDIYNPSACQNNCGNRGICRYGRCFCDPGFSGDIC